jgi:hypothetical protein
MNTLDTSHASLMWEISLWLENGSMEEDGHLILAQAVSLWSSG